MRHESHRQFLANRKCHRWFQASYIWSRGQWFPQRIPSPAQIVLFKTALLVYQWWRMFLFLIMTSGCGKWCVFSIFWTKNLDYFHLFAYQMAVSSRRLHCRRPFGICSLRIQKLRATANIGQTASKLKAWSHNSYRGRVVGLQPLFSKIVQQLLDYCSHRSVTEQW